MTNVAEAINDAEWLTAAEALRRVERAMGESAARRAIASRAHDGLLRTRAERFIKHRETFEDVELPRQFWWAEGLEALEQNWVSGDFSTWIDDNQEWKAYGVRFHRDGIRKLIPSSPAVSAFAAMINGAAAINRFAQAAGGREAAAQLLFRYARVGAIPTSVRFLRTETDDDEPTVENDRLLQVEHWRGIDQPTAAQLASGTLAGAYWDPVQRCTITTELVDLRFSPDDIERLIPLLPPPAGEPGPPLGKGVGSPVEDEDRWVSARDAVHRIMGATGQGAISSLDSIVAYAKTGDLEPALWF